MNTENLIVWCLLALGLWTYQRLLVQIMRLRSGDSSCDGNWCETLERLVAALPLLGLLGTIVGLLDTFAAMARGEGLAGGMASGIVDALWTTQLGLVLAVPGWLMLAYLKRLCLNRELYHARQSSAAA